MPYSRYLWLINTRDRQISRLLKALRLEVKVYLLVVNQSLGAMKETSYSYLLLLLMSREKSWLMLKIQVIIAIQRKRKIISTESIKLRSTLKSL